MFEFVFGIHNISTISDMSSSVTTLQFCKRQTTIYKVSLGYFAAIFVGM